MSCLYLNSNLLLIRDEYQTTQRHRKYEIIVQPLEKFSMNLLYDGWGYVLYNFQTDANMLYGHDGILYILSFRLCYCFIYFPLYKF